MRVQWGLSTWRGLQLLQHTITAQYVSNSNRLISNRGGAAAVVYGVQAKQGGPAVGEGSLVRERGTFVRQIWSEIKRRWAWELC